jgi:hypothetical protein
LLLQEAKRLTDRCEFNYINTFKHVQLVRFISLRLQLLIHFAMLLVSCHCPRNRCGNISFRILQNSYLSGTDGDQDTEWPSIFITMRQITLFQIQWMTHIGGHRFPLRTDYADSSGTFAGFFFIEFRHGRCIPGDLFFSDHLARKWAQIATSILDQRYGLRGT